MEIDPQDEEIIRLLTKLKNAGAAYPEDMLAARRQSYLKQMAEIGMGFGANGGIKNAAKHAGSSSVSPATSTLLEGALVVAIIAETSAVAYFYRDKLTDLFKTITTVSKVQEVTPPPALTALEVQGVTPSPAVTSTLPSATISASPSGTIVTLSSTPMPGVVNKNGVVNQANSTPAPNGNNGNHYGQTPKPERTKQPNTNDKPPKNNNNQNSNPNPNDKPPKNK